jgi:hypothetical protein
VIGLLLAAAGIVMAGSLNPGSGPGDAGSQMFTLQQIYDRLDIGAAGSKMTAFTEPASGPGSGTMRTLDEVMGKAPAVDDANGATAADVVSGRKFWGLTSGAWGLQTGTASGGGTYNAGVPKTGQTTCYDNSAPQPSCPVTGFPGQDGELQKGVTWPTPRFTANVDNNNDGDCIDSGETCNGTVTDNLTGLIWLKNASCGGTRNWANALTFANSLYDGWTGASGGDCGLLDGSTAGQWRLPNVRELLSLIDYGRFGPALPTGHPFSGVVNNYYWTSTTHASHTVSAWFVILTDGYALGREKWDTIYVWPVRGGQ